MVPPIYTEGPTLAILGNRWRAQWTSLSAHDRVEASCPTATAVRGSIRHKEQCADDDPLIS